ncbi:calcium-binding protein [Sagittula sp. S175]|uniref:calcium-binding protein n=1 Tax=Sagittula sp. S175 TaxID=3415129 RepID=UPI003C7D6810
MATITETNDSYISAYASGNYTIGFDDTFAGTFGGGDTADGINLPTFEAGTMYTISITLDDVNDLSNLTIINPNNFHSTGFNIDNGTVTNPGAWEHPTGMGTRVEMRVIGNTVEFDFIAGSTQWYSLQINGDGATTTNYTVSVAPAVVPPLFTEVADVVTGTAGDDAADLLGGDDSYMGGDGNDTVNGMNGADTIYGENGDDLIHGNEGNDYLQAGEGNNVVYGDGGIDTIIAGAGNDTLYGGNDDDEVHGNAGNDLMFGGTGNDVLGSGTGADTLDGGEGDDTLHIGDGEADVIIAAPGMGTDSLMGYDTGIDKIDVTAFGIYDVSQITVSDNGTDTTLTFSDGSAIVIAERTGLTLTNADFILADAPPPPPPAPVSDDDIIVGTIADEMFNAGKGNDDVSGGDGADTLYGASGADTLNGDAGADALYGGNDDDVLNGGAGDDFLDGGKGGDLLDGGDGNDTFLFSEGNDAMTGGAGADTFLVNNSVGITTITDFTGGADKLDVSAFGIYDAGQLAMTDDGTDTTIDFGNGTVVVLQGVLAASVTNADLVLAANPFAASAANDTVTGGETGDVISGGDGDDRLFGMGGNDVLNGDAGKDDLRGGAGNDSLYGGDSNDKLQGEDGDDQLFGGNNNDNLQGGAGADILNGEHGNDMLDGGDDNDQLYGGIGHDKLFGGAGNDYLAGESGRDVLTGGAGADVFVFATGTSQDIIADFEDNLDQIDLSGLAGVGITQFADLAISQVGADVVIAFEGNNQVTLQNTDIANIDAGDFLF